MFATFKKPEATTISDTDVMDNFFFQLDNVREFVIQGIDKFDERIDEARSISSNRPCWIDLHTTDDD